MKKKHFKVVNIAAVLIFIAAFFLNLQTGFNGSSGFLGITAIAGGTGGSGGSGTGSGSGTGTGTGGGGVGCYIEQTLDCGLDLGDQLFCNFTGSYGAPYKCESIGCLNKHTKHECVPPPKNN